MTSGMTSGAVTMPAAACGRGTGRSGPAPEPASVPRITAPVAVTAATLQATARRRRASGRSSNSAPYHLRREAAPHRDQRDCVEREDDQREDRDVEEREAERQHGQQEQRAPLVHRCASPPRCVLVALEHHDRHHQQQQHRDGDRARHRPVAVGEELIPQHAADHQRIRAAEQLGNHELADRRDEHQHRAGDDAGHRQRQRDRRERLPAACAPRSAAASSSVRSMLHEVRVQRQDHERQVRIDDADVHREVGVHHRRAARR